MGHRYRQQTKDLCVESTDEDTHFRQLLHPRLTSLRYRVEIFPTPQPPLAHYRGEIKVGDDVERDYRVDYG